MAFEESLRSISLAADSSVAGYTGVPGLPGSADPNSGKQYRFVKVTGDRAIGLCVLATDKCVGVVQNKPQVAGAAATVGIRGVSFVVAGGTVEAADEVTSDDEGRAVAVGEGDSTFGVALTGGAEGELISVLLG